MRPLQVWVVTLFIHALPENPSKTFAHGLADGQIVRNYIRFQSNWELHECLDNCEDLKIFARAKGVFELLPVAVLAPEAIKVLRRDEYYDIIKIGTQEGGFYSNFGIPKGLMLTRIKPRLLPPIPGEIKGVFEQHGVCDFRPRRRDCSCDWSV